MGSLDSLAAVEACLDFMGPLLFTEKTAKQAIVDHVEKQGAITFGDESSGIRKKAENRISEILALIASSKEYQRC